MPVPSGQLKHTVTHYPRAGTALSDRDLVSTVNAGTAGVKCLLIVDREVTQLSVFGDFQGSLIKLMHLPGQPMSQGDVVKLESALGPYPAGSFWQVVRAAQGYQDLGKGADWFSDAICQRIQGPDPSIT